MVFSFDAMGEEFGKDEKIGKLGINKTEALNLVPLLAKKSKHKVSCSRSKVEKLQPQKHPQVPDNSIK